MAIYAQASDRRDQGPSPDGVADDYAAADGGYFAAGQTTASVDAWALGMENSAVLVVVWEDHGGVELLDDLLLDHQRKRALVTEYKGTLKPKLAYRNNYPIDIRKFGPLVRSW